MNKKTLAIFIGCIALFCAIFSVVFQQLHREEAISSVYKIGWIGPLSGPSAVLGMDSVVAAQIAVDEVNESGGILGVPVELLVEDDQYDAAQTVSAYHTLVNVHGVDIIVMQTYGGVFAVSDLAAKDGVLLIDSLDCNSNLSGLGDHVFCLATETESIANVLVDYLHAQAYSRIGVLYFSSDTFMPYVREHMERRFLGDVIAEAYVAGSTDFRTSLGKMKARGVEALVFLGYDETGLAMKQARDLGLDVLFLSTGTITSPSLQEAAHGHAEGAFFAFWEAPSDGALVKNFDEEFESRVERGPILDLATYPTYDVFLSLFEAARRSAGLSAVDVSSGLFSLEQFRGITGDISFSDQGAYAIPEKLYRLNDGIPQLVQ